ncbi:MAG: hypothetical protein DRI34_09535 [Deltaproteobacteria bacterium]|nr:MAG: hypothetical protein DRI34_09535 [Deltaproteobacteria bacterium]
MPRLLCLWLCLLLAGCRSQPDQPTASPRQAAAPASEQNTARQLGLLLIDAARDGDSRRIQGLLFRGADVLARDDRGRAVLHAFFSRRNWRLDEQLLQLLLRAGADPAARDASGKTPLHLAARRGRAGPVRVLLAAAASVAARDRHGSTPLHLAARAGAVEVLQTLVKAGARIAAVDERGRSALALAATADECPAGLWLAGRGARVTANDAFGRSPLAWLAGCCLAACGDDTSDEDAWPDVCRRAGPLRAAALQRATREGSRRLAGLLLLAGADPDAPGYFDPAIGVAGIRPLQVAAWAGYTEMAALLLDLGAHLQATDRNGWTALDWAAFKNRLAVGRLLLARGADPRYRALDGKQALERVSPPARASWRHLLDRRVRRRSSR